MLRRTIPFHISDYSDVIKFILKMTGVTTARHYSIHKKSQSLIQL